ncbi:MAG TPA: hypothetical protein VJH96_03595 [Patescibacteria group bacterium]|nr:hypothetical protein [Patescibacteria group bacterium]
MSKERLTQRSPLSNNRCPITLEHPDLFANGNEIKKTDTSWMRLGFEHPIQFERNPNLVKTMDLLAKEVVVFKK